MRKYITKIGYFIIPVIFIFITIFIVDPYNFINLSHIIEDTSKIKVYKRSDAVSPRGTILWKAVKFKRKPVKNIIIGDSQGTGISEEQLNGLTGEDYFNFCVPGSSYNTMFDCFWYCLDNVTPENVYFQIGFMNFNANRPYNLFHFAQDYFDKPYTYFTNKDIMFDSFYNLFYSITKKESLVNKSKEYFEMQKQDQFSENALNMFFRNYQYPDEYIVELRKISEYCLENEINLNFMMLPVYYKVNDYLKTHNLKDEESRFRDDIKAIGNTFDFTYDEDISKERNNFYDYFHSKDDIVSLIVSEIWKKE